MVVRVGTDRGTPVGVCRRTGVVGLVEPGSTVQIAMNIPIAIQEMVLAGLIVKGFDASAIDPVSDPAGIAPVSHR